MTSETAVQAKPPRDADLRTPRMPLMSWASESVADNLARLYDWAQRYAVDAIDWYMAEKERKARWSRGLRSMAAILATAGGAVPIAAWTVGNPAAASWGFLLLALAAGCVGYDRFFGYSSAWQRYVAAAIALRARLVDFQLQWAQEMARSGNASPDAEGVAQRVGLVRSFAASINELITSETDAWLAEFNNRLSELETRLLQPPQGDRH